MPDPRGNLLRTKTGCLTCRIRRVKCDETKPLCVRCTKTGRQCDGYSSTPISRRELIARQFPDPNLTAFERKCFELFRLRTAKADWDVVLQLSHIEPSIRHGVLALGSLHHEFEYDPANSISAYHNAIQHTRTLNDPTKILAACVIFVCYENIMGNYGLAKMHLQNGLKIARQSRNEDTIFEILGRLDFQAMAFADLTTPYGYGTPGLQDYKIPHSFINPKEARISMVDLQRWAMSIAEAFKQGDHSSDLADARMVCQERLRDWKASFDRSKTENWVPMPKLYWALATLAVGPGCEDKETAWDDHYSMMELLVLGSTPLARLKSFSLEMGTTYPLYTVATKCRDPRLRRRAIDLMKTPRREGIWYSPEAARIASRVTQIEEHNRIVSSAEDIPEEARVRSILTKPVVGKNCVQVQFTMRPGKENVFIDELIEY